MTKEEWEEQLDERMRWHSFLPLLGTKAFENMLAKINVTGTRQAFTGRTPQENAEPAAGEEASSPKEGDV